MSAGIALFKAASSSCIILPFFMREPLTLRGNDAVAKLPRLSRATRGLSCDHEDAIDATRHRIDASAATTSTSRTLSQHRGNCAKSTSFATATNFCKSGKSPGLKPRARHTVLNCAGILLSNSCFFF